MVGGGVWRRVWPCRWQGGGDATFLYRYVGFSGKTEDLAEGQPFAAIGRPEDVECAAPDAGVAAAVHDEVQSGEDAEVEAEAVLLGFGWRGLAGFAACSADVGAGGVEVLFAEIEDAEELGVEGVGEGFVLVAEGREGEGRGEVLDLHEGERPIDGLRGVFGSGERCEAGGPGSQGCAKLCESPG